ncbi:MAG: glycosyltransferase family 2 protein [Bacteroidales bacterium]|nr:glycosyltransferase family 2 protein [Bacteroidales bacterium]
MTPKISVIIPVYNVEKYVAECARSLFSQTFAEAEFIFVNDCTPDGSMSVIRSVLEEFPQRRQWVKEITKQVNEGLPAARKSGLEAARGEYILHFDSDDFAEPQMLEKLYAEAQSTGAETVVCAWFKDNTPQPTKYTRRGVNCREKVLSDMIAVGEMQSEWRYMVRKDVYSRGITFPSHSQGEDQALMVQLAFHSKSIYSLPEPLYHWRTNDESMTHEPSKESVIKRFKDSCANVRLVEDFLTARGCKERYREELTALKLYAAFYLRPLLRKGEAAEMFAAAFPEIKSEVYCNKLTKFAHKVEYFINTHCSSKTVKAIYRWRNSCR